jgi:DNA ligase 1
MKFSQFRKAADAIKATSGRAKETLIRELLQSASSTNERIAMGMMLCGRLVHIDEPHTTGIKETFIANDLALEGTKSHEAMDAIVAQRAVPTHTRDVVEVWDWLRTYVESDDRSKDRKSRIITDCLHELPGEKEDASFLLRLLTGKLGNGVDDRTILRALWPNSHEKVIRAYGFNPSLGTWIWSLDNPDDPDSRVLMDCRPIPGIPLEPQLCARVKDIATVIAKHGGSTMVQTKLDGMRINVHITREREGSNGSFRRYVSFYSREQKNVTEDYAELFDQFANLRLSRECILDGELVALDEEGRILPFNFLQKRMGRKVNRANYKVGIVLYDILLYDDENLKDMPYVNRYLFLHGMTLGPKVKVIKSRVCTDASQVEEMLMEAHGAGEEGLVCKDARSKPGPGTRGYDWIKLKVDYMDGDFGDTFDLVVMGYNHGKGRRHGTVGALWAGVPGEPFDDLIPLCKISSGLTDEDLEWFRANLKPIPDGPILHCDVQVEPDVVIEVRAAQVSRNQHGVLSLRFPRFIRVRADKEPRSATTLAEIREGLR